MTRRLSVVIPTRGRAEVLHKTLSSLAEQSAPPETFEVIVVVDGEEGNPLGVRSMVLPYRLTVLSQQRAGAAAARNRGAESAKGSILLFLDDDMSASVDLVKTHLSMHATGGVDVVLGHFSQASTGLSDPFLAAYVRAWWGRRFSDLAQPGHRFSYDDVFSGNVSLGRDRFWRVGGFDERFSHAHAGEDYELGRRLLAGRARFGFAPAASAVHEDDPTVDRALARAYAAGRGHGIIAREHPELLPRLTLGRAIFEPVPSVAPRARPPRKPTLALSFARALRTRRAWNLFFGRVHHRAYWSGVLAQLGSAAALRRLIQEADLRPDERADASFDVRTGHAGLVEALGPGDVMSLEVWVGDTPICRIPKVAGAEPLRPVHVVDWLARSHAWTVVRAMGLTGWTLGIMPDRVEASTVDEAAGAQVGLAS